MFLYNTIRNGFQNIRQGIGGALTRTKGVIEISSGPMTADYGIQNEMTFLHEQMRVYAGIHHLRRTPFSDNFTGETREMRLKYRYALAEPSVKAALLGKIISVCSLSLQVKPKNRADRDPRSRDVADNLKYAIEASEYGSFGVLWEMLSGGLIDGWSVSEKVWGIETRGRWRGYRILKNLKSKDSRYVQPEVDPFLNVTALYSTRGNSMRRFDPANYVILSYMSLFQNPTGMSDLRASYRAIEMLPALVRMRMVFLEKYVGPFLKGKIKDKAIRKKMYEELADARAKGYIVYDESSVSDVEVVNLATSSVSEFQSAITDLRQEVAIGISGAFLHMLTGETPGARGNSQIQQETTESFVWMLGEMASNRIERRIAPDIVDYNFGSQTEIPDVKLEAVSPQDIQNDLGIDKILHEMGVGLDIDDILERARRPIPMSKDRTLAGMMASGPNPFTGLTVPGQAPDVFAEQDKFTGTLTDSAGRKQKYVNGVHVASGESPESSRHPSVRVAKERADSRGNDSSLVGRPNELLSSESRPELNADEIAEIQDYLDDNSEYYEINDDMRAGGRMPYAASVLQGAIEKSGVLTEPIVAHRGISLSKDKLDSLITQLNSGTFEDSGFLSASSDRSFPGNVQFSILVKKGLDASFYGSNSGEILLPAGSNFKVLGVKRDGNKVSVKMEQII